MQESPSELAELSFCSQPPALGAILRESLVFILTHQYVFCPLTGTTHLVTKGSGQGMRMSGDLADMVFNQLVEKPYASKEVVRRVHGIHSYIRYRDDILLIASGEALSRRYFGVIKHRAKPVWNISCEEVSSYAMPFLDFTVFKSHSFASNGQLSIKFYKKATAHGRRLAPHSAHPHNVHRSWPLSEVSRIACRCSVREDFETVKTAFTKELRACGFSDQYLNRLGQEKFDLIRQSPLARSAVSVQPRRTTLWLVLPFCASINFKRMRDRLTKLMVEWKSELEFIFGDCTLNISFKNAGASTASTVQLTNCGGWSGGRRSFCFLFSSPESPISPSCAAK